MKGIPIFANEQYAFDLERSFELDLPMPTLQPLRSISGGALTDLYRPRVSIDKWIYLANQLSATKRRSCTPSTRFSYSWAIATKLFSGALCAFCRHA